MTGQAKQLIQYEPVPELTTRFISVDSAEKLSDGNFTSAPSRAVGEPL